MTKKLPAKCGADWARGEDWRPMVKSRKGWEQWAARNNELRHAGFMPVVCCCDSEMFGSFAPYYRVNYGK